MLNQRSHTSFSRFHRLFGLPLEGTQAPSVEPAPNWELGFFSCCTWACCPPSGSSSSRPPPAAFSAHSSRSEARSSAPTPVARRHTSLLRPPCVCSPGRSVQVRGTPPGTPPSPCTSPGPGGWVPSHDRTLQLPPLYRWGGDVWEDERNQRSRLNYATDLCPSCLHTTAAFRSLQPESQILPQSPWRYTSTRPSILLPPPTSRTRGPGRKKTHSYSCSSLQRREGRWWRESCVHWALNVTSVVSLLNSYCHLMTQACWWGEQGPWSATKVTLKLV